jgi:hypothetical protein
MRAKDKTLEEQKMQQHHPDAGGKEQCCTKEGPPNHTRHRIAARLRFLLKPKVTAGRLAVRLGVRWGHETKGRRIYSAMYCEC